MGTNFYWLAPEHAPCPHCGRAADAERLHIGKSSAGWVFALHVIPESGIHGLGDWRKRFEIPGSVVVNEYGESVPLEELLHTITERQGRPWNTRESAWYGYDSEEEFHRANGSERGPNGLLQSKIDGRRCIGHGHDGTYDLRTGEFS